jgi:nitrite reductase/ring-hydroxylating ferredoxin subunit/multimeric flavodoxin WrbA
MERLPKNNVTSRDDEDNDSLRFICFASEIQDGKAKSITVLDDKQKSLEVAVFNIKGKFYAISNTCIHKGGPLSEGFLEGETVTCPWHGWKYSVRDGKSPHKGGDSINSYEVKVIEDKIYVNSIPSNIGKRVFQPHEAYVELDKSVNDYLMHISKDEILPDVERKTRVLGISTTNANDKMAPRRSTSEEALNCALDFAKNKLNAETVMIKLRDLNFRHCEGYYSKNAKACIFPCSISEIDEEDQMIKIYEKIILWADVIIIATPIRWGNASSLYYQMIQRLNCVQNQSITHGRYLIRDKVAAFIITGGQDNVQHIAGELMSFWSQLGFVFGKFPFVGWSRGWYAEDTENNYNKMVENISKSHSVMQEDMVRTLLGATELSKLITKNRYDENVLDIHQKQNGKN